MKKILKIKWIAFFLLNAFSALSLATTFYVAPSGSDLNLGTKISPFATITAAQAAASSGDTVFLRGGTYILENSNISAYVSIRAVVFNITKSGISYLAYPGEHPIFDFSNVKPSGYRVSAFRIAANDNVFDGFDIVGVQVTIADQRTQSEAIIVDGGNRNRFERLAIHDGMGIGWYLVKGSDNLVINCDAYRNKGLNSFSDGNVDGFGAHPASVTGTGNIIRGSRAWFNSDDGFDLINASAAVVIENSWAFFNGYNTDFSSLADGNGFKAGGYGAAGSAYPTPVPRHVVRYCLSVRNKAGGFYANHHIGGQDWIGNTAINNSTNYNMLSTLSDNDTDVPGYGHYMRNNLGFGGSKQVVNLGSATDNNIASNYFNLSVTVSAADFVSLDETLLSQPRQSNGDLPVIDFAKLAPGSDLINAGADLGSPYGGSAPDLGAFEARPLAPAALAENVSDNSVSLYWSAVAEPFFNHYKVYRSTSKGGAYAVIASGVTNNSYTDSSVMNGSSYYYVVTVVANNVESGFSNEVIGIPKALQVSSSSSSAASSFTSVASSSLSSQGFSSAGVSASSKPSMSSSASISSAASVSSSSSLLSNPLASSSISASSTSSGSSSISSSLASSAYSSASASSDTAVSSLASSISVYSSAASVASLSSTSSDMVSSTATSTASSAVNSSITSIPVFGVSTKRGGGSMDWVGVLILLWLCVTVVGRNKNLSMS